jgi:hypothetical protein
MMKHHYKITAIPGFAWSGDFISSLTIYYVASAVFIVAAFFHLFYHGFLYNWSTWLHNIFFILFILAFAGHSGAIILKPNRPMVRGIFTGTVRLGPCKALAP